MRVHVVRANARCTYPKVVAETAPYHGRSSRSASWRKAPLRRAGRSGAEGWRASLSRSRPALGWAGDGMSTGVATPTSEHSQYPLVRVNVHRIMAHRCAHQAGRRHRNTRVCIAVERHGGKGVVHAETAIVNRPGAPARAIATSSCVSLSRNWAYGTVAPGVGYAFISKIVVK